MKASHKLLQVLLLGLVLTLFCGPLAAAAAQTAGQRLYISDKLRVYARAGAGNQYKLLTPLKTGDQVKVIEETADGWVHIRYGKDRDGWIQKRFLTAAEPARQRLARAEAKIARLEQDNKARIASLTETNKEYRKGNTALLREVKELRSKLKKVERDYATLRQESAGFLELKEKYEKLQKEDQARREREDTILAECERLRTAYRIKWFLTGAGVLLIGFFIGLLMELFRNRRKKSTGLSFR